MIFAPVIHFTRLYAFIQLYMTIMLPIILQMTLRFIFLYGHSPLDSLVSMLKPANS